jgi:hypothetical protein
VQSNRVFPGDALFFMDPHLAPVGSFLLFMVAFNPRWTSHWFQFDLDSIACMRLVSCKHGFVLFNSFVLQRALFLDAGKGTPIKCDQVCEELCSRQAGLAWAPSLPERFDNVLMSFLSYLHACSGTSVGRRGAVRTSLMTMKVSVVFLLLLIPFGYSGLVSDALRRRYVFWFLFC